MSTYLLLVRNSATSAAVIASTGAEGAANQARHLQSLGLRIVGHWLALGGVDQVFVIEGSTEAVLTFQLAAQMGGQGVELIPLVEPAVADDIVALLSSLPSSGMSLARNLTPGRRNGT